MKHVGKEGSPILPDNSHIFFLIIAILMQFMLFMSLHGLRFSRNDVLSFILPSLWNLRLFLDLLLF